MRLRIRFEEIFLAAIFCIIGAASLLLFDHLETQAAFSAASRGFYSANAVCFDLYGDDSQTEYRDCSQEFFDFLKGDEIKDLIIWIYDFKEPNTYGTYFSDKSYALPVVYGRYFEAGDFFCGKNLALNADNWGNGTELDATTLYLRKSTGVLYKNIGAVQYPTMSELDITVIVNIDSLIFTTAGGMCGVLDGPNKASVKRNMALLTEFFEQYGMRVVETSTPIPSFTVSDFLGVETLNLVMYLFGIYTVVLSTAPLTLYWVTRRRRAAAVKRMLGFSTSLIVLQMYGRMAVIFNIGFIAGAAGMSVIKVMGLTATTDISAGKLAGAYALTLVFSILVSLVPLVKTMQTEPGDALRKDV